MGAILFVIFLTGGLFGFETLDKQNQAAWQKGIRPPETQQLAYANPNPGSHLPSTVANCQNKPAGDMQVVMGVVVRANFCE
ncbi:MAG: hypothetical protein V3S39_00080 [Thermodesulfobacteriota bacterium]